VDNLLKGLGRQEADRDANQLAFAGSDPVASEFELDFVKDNLVIRQQVNGGRLRRGFVGGEVLSHSSTSFLGFTKESQFQVIISAVGLS
jgi:hypothetical protein